MELVLTEIKNNKTSNISLEIEIIQNYMDIVSGKRKCSLVEKKKKKSRIDTVCIFVFLQITQVFHTLWN